MQTVLQKLTVNLIKKYYPKGLDSFLSEESFLILIKKSYLYHFRISIKKHDGKTLLSLGFYMDNKYPNPVFCFEINQHKERGLQFFPVGLDESWGSRLLRDPAKNHTFNRKSLDLAKVCEIEWDDYFIKGETLPLTFQGDNKLIYFEE